MSKDQVIAIVGPTASGKTAVAIQIAQENNGEIVCADSRTVYRGMNLGTAKPTPTEQDQVRHHLLDVVDPGERFTVAEFQRLAMRAIADIQSRGKLPIVVGGSGLYVDALLYGFTLRPEGSVADNQMLAKLTNEQLREAVKQKGLTLNASDLLNRRRLERAVLSGTATIQPKQLPDNYFVIGLNPGVQVIEQRIAARTKSWFETSIIEETNDLIKKYGQIEPLNTSPYREIAEYLVGGGDLSRVQALINLHLRQLAKRQLTWLKRNPDIRWTASLDEAVETARKIGLV